ncbi:hypothetical protein BJY59DRAFT_703566 [Rhodotorula toruloides]
MKRSGPLISVAPTHTQLAYGSFEVAFTHSLPVAAMPEGWQRAEPGFRVEWARHKQGQSTITRLLRSILSNVPTATPNPTEEAPNGASKYDWLGHITSSASATHRACSIILEHGSEGELFRRLVLLSINVFNYITNMRSYSLFPSDDLICGAIGDAKLAIYAVPLPGFLRFYSGADSRSCSIPTSSARTFALAGNARSCLPSFSHTALARQPACPQVAN